MFGYVIPWHQLYWEQCGYPHIILNWIHTIKLCSQSLLLEWRWMTRAHKDSGLCAVLSLVFSNSRETKEKHCFSRNRIQFRITTFFCVFHFIWKTRFKISDTPFCSFTREIGISQASFWAQLLWPSLQQWGARVQSTTAVISLSYQEKYQCHWKRGVLKKIVVSNKTKTVVLTTGPGEQRRVTKLS